MLALALPVSSISTYVAVSREFIVKHLRVDLRSQAAAIEEWAQARFRSDTRRVETVNTA